MEEVYNIKRDDTGQYYHSLTPNGNMLWTDIETEAQYLTFKKASLLIDRVNGHGNPKYDQFTTNPIN